MPDPAKATRDGDRSLIVTRRFHAPRAAVWRAFTEPALLTRWLLGPPGWEMHVCEMDLRVGGGYTWRWRHPDQGEFGFTGTYSEVEAERRLKDRQVYDPGTLGAPMADAMINTVTFEDVEGGTQVITRMDFSTAEARDQGLASGMAQGMEMSYVNLDRLIAAEGPDL